VKGYILEFYVRVGMNVFMLKRWFLKSEVFVVRGVVLSEYENGEEREN